MQIRYLISRIWKEQPLRFLLSVIALTVAGLLEGIGIAAIVPMLTILQGGANAAASAGIIGHLIMLALSLFHLPFDLATTLAFILVVILCSEAATLTQQRLLASSSTLFEATLRKRLFTAVFDADWPYFVRTKTNDLISALINDTTRAGMAYVTLAQILGAIILALVYMGLSLILSWQMTIAVVILGVVVATLLRSRVGRGTKFGQEITRVDAEIHKETSENLAAAKLVKASSTEGGVRKRFDILTEARQRVQYHNFMNQAWLRALYESSAMTIVFVGIYAGVTYFGMSIATLAVFLFVFYRLTPRMANLQADQSNVLSFVPGLKRVDQATADASAVPEESGEVPLEPFSEAITLADVSFAYDPGHLVLRHISLSIPHGQSTAIVGPSGAGKTTVMDLVMGLLRPTSGNIMVDGTSLADIRLSDWRHQIGYVPQDASFFHATVAENIALGLTDIAPEKIVEAAKLADADEFIQLLPEGYDTIVGDRGVRLSGGQRQRLALARAIVREPSILVLDEATSALDAESEERVQRAVDRLSESLTVLIVTHRLATVTGCDKIFVLVDGQLTESGTWDELMARNGQFAELVELQALSSHA